MFIVISPAKSLDYESELPTEKFTQPRLLDDSFELIQEARKVKNSLSSMSIVLKIGKRTLTYIMRVKQSMPLQVMCIQDWMLQL